MASDTKSKSSTVSLVSIGDKLRTAREQKYLTIEQIQKHTSIHSTVLKALEEDRCDEILTPTYAKSFLKKYAHYLGLDSREILNDYSSLHHDLQAKRADITKLDTKDSTDPSGLLYVMKYTFFVLIALAVVVFLSVKTISHFRKAKPMPAKGRAAALDMSKKRSIKSAKDLSAPKKGISGPIAGKKTPLSAKKVRDSSSISQISIPQNMPLKVSMQIKEPVLVEATKDGVLIFKRVLQKGTESFTVDDSLILYVAKAEAVRLSLNGKPLGSLGSGTKNLEITRRGIKIK